MFLNQLSLRQKSSSHIINTGFDYSLIKLAKTNGVRFRTLSG